MIACYAAWNKSEDVLRESTSGGVFTALAEPVLKCGGIVVGAAYGDGLKVVHYVAHDLVELTRLRGVKYVFSEIGKSVMEEMAGALDAGKSVMFVGTPCQAAAIRKRFGYAKKLLLCDLVCFGAPSNSLWLKYIAWREYKKGDRLKNLSPRDKSHGWSRKTYYRYEWADGSVDCRASLYDPYSYAFYSALGFRKCCFACMFKGFDRVSDITLGDFWGAEKLGLPSEVLKNGVSGVMVHSGIGMSAFETANVCRMEVGKDVLLAENHMIERSAAMPERWTEFNEDAKTKDFGGLVKKYALQVTRFQVMKWQLRAWASRLKGWIIARVKFAKSPKV